MADFSPFGFNWQYSQTVSANALSPIVEYPWNPLFSGYSGDLCVAFLIQNGGTIPTGTTPTMNIQGYVYPAPVNTLPQITIGAETATATVPPIIGVIVGFKFTPKRNPSVPVNGFDGANFYNPLVTPVESGSKITVLVNTDPTAIYSVQSFNGVFTNNGIAQNQIFNYFPLAGDTTYSMTVGDAPNNVTWTFAYGNNDTGISKQYLNAADGTTPSFVAGSVAKPRTKPLQVVGITKKGNNDWSTNTDVQSNNLVNVRFNINMINTQFYDAIEQ